MITNVNSGVQANTGMNFQKNCAIYLFLERYEDIKDEKYFIILEHQDDIIFGYLSDENSLKTVETIQAKKSTNKWTLNSLIEIIKKIALSSQDVLNDNYPKTDSFYQKNYFTTNNTIELKGQNNNTKYNTIINEENANVSFSNLDHAVKTKILQGNKNVTFTKNDISNLENFHFHFIDIGRTSKAQREQLIGKFRTVFGNRITDHIAALDTLTFRLNEIECTFNQGDSANLSDFSKRIESSEINEIIDTLTSKKLAYDFWRSKKDEVCQSLQINIFDRDLFEFHYISSFDKFKDLNESEHRKINTFVKDNKEILKRYYTDKECINALYSDFNTTKSTTLSGIQLKAAISAAYLETINSL